MKNAIIKGIASGLYSGYIRPFPGTWGTIPAWLLAYFLIRDNTTLMIAAAGVGFVASVWFSGRAEELLGHDSRKIVIDEWAGMMVALLFIPYALSTFVMAFFAFRFFDVVKLPPAAQFEKLPRGWGVTMDDIIAGVQANVTVQLIMFVAELVFDYSFI